MMPETTPEMLAMARRIVKDHYPEMPANYAGRRVQIALAAITAWNHRTPPAPSGGEVERVARAVMTWGAPHFKHIVSFNTLCEAIKPALAAMDRAPGVDDIIRATVEEAEQACRYMAKHNIPNMEAGKYRDGFETACEVCETAIAEHVARHRERITQATQPAPRPVEAGEVPEPPFIREVYMQAQGKLSAARAQIEGLRNRLTEIVEALERDGDPAFAHLGIDARATLSTDQKIEQRQTTGGIVSPGSYLVGENVSEAVVSPKVPNA